MEVIKNTKYTLKQIFQDNWNAFVKTHRSVITWYAAYNVWKVMNCREPDGLGFTTFACPVHREQVCHVPKSCKSRFCPVCAKVQIDKWVSAMIRRFPNCPYYHITFTVPSQFRTLLFEKKALLSAVFAASTETLISFCKEMGFLPAVTAVLHTFGSDLKRHVHLHCVISAGGLKLSGRQKRHTRSAGGGKNARQKIKIKVVTKNPKWIKHSYFPFKMLHKRYQALLLKHLKKRIEENINSENPDADLLPFSSPDVMQNFFDDLRMEYSKGFYVHVSKKRQDLEPTIAYIGRYAMRPPMSEVRIKGYTGEFVTFEFKDYRRQGSKVKWTLKSSEFIRRLIRHVPLHYFNVIRHYGILASRVKSAYKKITDKLLNAAATVKKFKDWRQRQTEHHGQDPLLCKICNRAMQFVSHHATIPLSVVKDRFKASFS